MEKHRIIDMHTHSNASDGCLSPSEVLSYGKSKGLETMSLTDHDTLSGNKSLTDEDKKDIEFITGIELSAKVTAGRMHILGYDLDIESNTINSRMQELHDNSVYSVITYLNQLKKDYGIVFSDEDVINVLRAERNIGRPDIALLCIKYGYAESVQDAFEKYLVDIYNKTREINKGISPEECIRLIKSAGGIPVIAHPHSLLKGPVALKSSLNELKSYGLEGIEVYHPHHNQFQRKEYLALAAKLNLLISGGTDFHGIKVKPDVEIASGINGNIDIKRLTLLDHIRSRK